MLNQYEHRTVAAKTLQPEWWVYHGTGAPRSEYVDATQTQDLYGICSDDRALFQPHPPQTPPTTVHAGAWVNCSGRIFVPSVGVGLPLATEEPLFALGANTDVDLEKEKHQFVGDVVDVVFFSRAREGQALGANSPVKVKYFDPSADA
jgi:hypothetical protein